MSTTLTNGLKLPDKGSVDWYANMQNNYTILDGAVGTIAEHTSALAGKAPLVHTHTKSDITDFPAYGNAAGTICEGNDSRLSDARTPVAHTHTKSDVTDLFNSANTWSASQTFTENSTFSNFITSKESAAIPAGSYGKGIVFRDYQNNRLGYIQPCLTSDNAKRLLIGADSGDVASNSNLIPNINNSVNLGSSSYQWNNLYAKNYFYNGVAWGLDKANVWTGTNTFRQNITYERTNFFHQAVNPCYYLKDTELEKGSLASTHVAYPGLWQDKNSAVLGYVRFVEYDTGKQTAEIRVSNLIKNGALDPTGSTVNCTVNLELQPSGEKSLIPEQNNDINLGISTNKWKSLNGINPGALSLPDFSAEFDVSGQIVPPTGESQISINWGKNTFTPSVNGWLSVRIHKATEIKIYREARASYCFDSRIDSASDICVCSPVVAGVEYTIKIQATQFSSGYDHFRLAPCLGNV